MKKNVTNIKKPLLMPKVKTFILDNGDGTAFTIKIDDLSQFSCSCNNYDNTKNCSHIEYVKTNFKHVLE